MKIALVGKGKRTDIPSKCLECIGYYALTKQKLKVPCNGAFREHCEYNGTEEEEEEEEE